MTVLVTGGAGYIGAHVVRALIGAGHDVAVADDLSTGIAERVPDGIPLHVDDIAAANATDNLIEVLRNPGIGGPVDAVVHLAARKQVGESVDEPEFYYLQNVGGLANVLAAMREVGIDKFVFSSSAAVYGEPDTAVVTEQSPTVPMSPYGETKLIGEWLVRAAGRAWGLNHISLRYFNVAGSASPELRDTFELNLIPIALGRVSRGQSVQIYGDDYPTADGTCVRDYVHVVDLADAHVAALNNVHAGPRAVNIGTGNGSSVREVLVALGDARGEQIPSEVIERRAGDPSELTADVSLAASAWDWHAKHTLADIAVSAV
jgi:UDP-glucose 4-epimerase